MINEIELKYAEMDEEAMDQICGDFVDGYVERLMLLHLICAAAWTRMWNIHIDLWSSENKKM